jgi:hypothetical protein
MLARFPEFVQLCLSEAMLGGGLPMPRPPPGAVEPPEHVAYQHALEQASDAFAHELMQTPPPGQGQTITLKFEEGSKIEINGRSFLRQHFARNFHLHFQRRVYAHYAAQGHPITQAMVTHTGDMIELAF